MYELMILALLMRWPMHGYLIGSVMNDIMGPHARVSHGRLYPLLAKLEAQGLVAAFAATGDRNQRTFQITAAGRERFRRLALDPAAVHGDPERVFWTKFAFFGLLAPAERLMLVERYLTYCRDHVQHLTGQLAEIEGPLATQGFMTPAQRGWIVDTMRHFIARWRLEIDEVERWRREHPDGGPAAAGG